ncbi:MAG: energy-coupling factor transporter transmembrane component T [Anaerolineales bacterium]
MITFLAGASPLHRVNPTMKLVGLAVIVAAATLAFDPYIPALLATGLWLLTLFFGRVPLVLLLRWSLRLLLLPMPLALLTALYTQVEPPVHPILSLGPWILTREGLVLGLGVGLRLSAILAGSMMYVTTTDPSDFAVSLVQNLRIPYRFAYGLLISYRFLPSLGSEAETLRMAHRVRGMGRSRTLRDRLGEFRRVAIPLLAAAIRRSERTALAMDARGFGAFADRTYLRSMKVRRPDIGFVLLCTAYATAAIALAVRLGVARLAWIPGA